MDSADSDRIHDLALGIQAICALGRKARAADWADLQNALITINESAGSIKSLAQPK